MGIYTRTRSEYVVLPSRYTQWFYALPRRHGTEGRLWARSFRSEVGARVDYFRVDVQSSLAANSGTNNASIVGPKLSLVFGPWDKTGYARCRPRERAD